jgi:hypothetical protein
MEIRYLIRDMSLANPLWGAPRIHGELLKLGIEIAQSTVAQYMAKSGRGRSQTWKTFLHNHAAGIAAMDFLIVPTVGFKLLFVLVILRHQRRRLISLNVTTNPTAEWIAHQLTDAFPWNEVPDHLIRDRDGSYGHAVSRGTSSSSAKPICAGSSLPTPLITMTFGRISPLARMHLSIVPSSAPARSLRDRSSADFIINTVGCSSR